MRGDRDLLVSAAWARRLAAALPSGSVTTIAGAPHAVVYSSVGAFVPAVQRFLDDLALR